MYRPAQYLLVCTLQVQNRTIIGTSETLVMVVQSTNHTSVWLGKVTDIGSSISKKMNYYNNEIKLLFKVVLVFSDVHEIRVYIMAYSI